MHGIDPTIYVIPTIVSNIKTGNIWHDVLLIFVILVCINCMGKIMVIITEKMYEHLYYKVKSKYIIPCANYTSHGHIRIEMPEAYKAIFYIINKLNIDIKYSKLLIDYNCNRLNVTDIECMQQELYYYFIVYNKEIQLDEDIYIRSDTIITTSDNTKSDFNKSDLLERYNLVVYSYNKTFCEIKNKIKLYIEEYRVYLDNINNKKYYLLYIPQKNVNKFMSMNNYDKQDTEKYNNSNQDKQEYKFHIHEFISNKEFNNIFFEQKNSLIKKLDFFSNNEAYYKKYGIPHTLGLLFTGLPGTGKTSCIKSIAKYTNRNVLAIHLSQIKTSEELHNIFYMNKYENIKLNFKNKIIVLEDIDCMSDIVKSRDEKSDDKDNNDDDKLTLSYLLNLFDGIEQPDRIIIMTTNYPEKLDKALIRPGRIDLQIEFKKCSREITKEILEYYYDNKKVDADKLPHYVYTPAELINMCLTYTSQEELINILCKID